MPLASSPLSPRAPLTSLALAAALLFVAAVPTPRTARAEDDVPTQVKAAIAELDAAHKAKDDAKIAEAAKEIVPLFKATQDGALRSSIARSLGSIVKNEKTGLTGRKAALAAIVATEDSSAGWKALQGAYPSNDAEDAEKWSVDIVAAVGALHPDGAIDTLIETFKKAKMPDLAAAGVAALGNYGKSKHREKIVEEIAKVGKNMVPSRGAGKNPSPETQQRWATVGPAIGKALDTITGDTVGDPTEWFKRIDEAKGKIKTLFKG